MQATYRKHLLNFKRPSGTSRGVLTTKESWFLELSDGNRKGIGECGLLRGLSHDDRPDYEEKLQWVCRNIHLGPKALWQGLKEFPSIQFGVETAFLSLDSRDPFLLFPSDFTLGEASIPINGLIWMGDRSYMQAQIREKLEAGFRCIKMKIGAIDFETELDLLQFIRREFPAQAIELRVDANGAFPPDEALEKLKRLSELSLHSIEQPIRQGQLEAMARLCEESPLPVALDEELIGVVESAEKRKLLEQIKPQYLIFKPSLIGGFKGTRQWLELAKEAGIGWWNTSALESNIGLNAIAQWTYTLKPERPQGLGTGSLFTNNIASPLEVVQGKIHYNPDLAWDF